MTAYAKSKRANIVLIQELARRLPGVGIVPVAVHPGFAVIGLPRHTSGAIMHLPGPLTRWLMGSAGGPPGAPSNTAISEAAHAGDLIAPAGHDQTSGTPRPVWLPGGAADLGQGR
jgi:NAD(P)-dependent dehydrogenase (short-subunit alcohol dehydrogenase family)